MQCSDGKQMIFFSITRCLLCKHINLNFTEKKRIRIHKENAEFNEKRNCVRTFMIFQYMCTAMSERYILKNIVPGLVGSIY